MHFVDEQGWPGTCDREPIGGQKVRSDWKEIRNQNVQRRVEGWERKINGRSLLHAGRDLNVFNEPVHVAFEGGE